MKIFTKYVFILAANFLLFYSSCNNECIIVNHAYVRIYGRQILVNNRPFTIKGIGYSPTPIGNDPTNPSLRYDIYIDSAIRNRDFPILRQMGCNTIRTWGKVTNHDFLKIAAAHGIYVVMGFWIDPHDFSDSIVRQSLKDEFRTYVSEFKNEPAVLMWSIGNEQNYEWMHKGSLKSWYTLLNEMALIAHKIEGDSYHPVTTPNGEILNIGDKNLGTDDGSLCNLDVWGANIYRGNSFYTLFSEYAAKSNKPFWVSEYGIPALDTSTMQPNEDRHASTIVDLWNEIKSNVKLCSGGTIMAYSDEWWKAGNPDIHDKNIEEWWGIFSVAQNLSGEPDIFTPRKAYFKLRDSWRER